MTDMHAHVPGNDPSVVEYLADRDFFGYHPWQDPDCYVANEIAEKIENNPSAWVGEIGFDRLRNKEISNKARSVFEDMLMIATYFKRPVTLHGVKCWGKIIENIKGMATIFPRPPAFLFHGFSRSDGLLPEIEKLNGFISVGPQVMNDHAVNYRKLVAKIPNHMLVFETDRTVENQEGLPTIREILIKTAEIRNTSPEELEKLTDENALRFVQF